MTQVLSTEFGFRDEICICSEKEQICHSFAEYALR